MNYIYSQTAASSTSTDAVVTASMPWQDKSVDASFVVSSLSFLLSSANCTRTTKSPRVFFDLVHVLSAKQYFNRLNSLPFAYLLKTLRSFSSSLHSSVFFFSKATQSSAFFPSCSCSFFSFVSSFATSFASKNLRYATGKQVCLSNVLKGFVILQHLAITCYVTGNHGNVSLWDLLLCILANKILQNISHKNIGGCWLQ